MASPKHKETAMIETVKVKGGPKGTRIINKSDFDPKKHTLAEEKRKPGRPKKVKTDG